MKMSKIKFEYIDYIIITVTFSVLFLVWLFILISYKDLPEIIPVHFDIQGNPDKYGGKENIFLAPCVFSAISIAMIFLSKYQPLLSNSNKTISKIDQKYIVKKMLLLGLILSCLVVIIANSMIFSELENSSNILLVTAFILILVSLFGLWYYKYKVYKK